MGMTENMGKITKSTGRVLAVATCALMSLSQSVTAANHDCEGFLPPNDMKVPVGFKATAGSPGSLSEAQFNAVLDRVQKLYSPVIAQEGGTLKINRLWSDATVNASAQQIGSSWVLNMYGGLARHPATTEEGFALVVCHELGHHLGGAPKIAGWFGGSNWASNEGAADYYANLKCLRNYYEQDDNKAIIAQAKLDQRLDAFAEKLCIQQFNTEIDQLICMRNSLGGTSVAGLFQDLRKETTPPDYSKPDTRRVTKTDDKHPATQCRMDTYLAGSVCPVDKSVKLSNTDYRQGSCVEGAYNVGYRPRCWFAP